VVSIGIKMKKLYFLLLISIITQACTAGKNSHDKIGYNDRDTSTQSIPLCSHVRIPAEWEPHEATWLLWPVVVNGYRTGGLMLGGNLNGTRFHYHIKQTTKSLEV
jgi:hypothetical protein